MKHASVVTRCLTEPFTRYACCITYVRDIVEAVGPREYSSVITTETFRLVPATAALLESPMALQKQLARLQNTGR